MPLIDSVENVLAPIAGDIIYTGADAAAVEVEYRWTHIDEPHIPEMHIAVTEPARVLVCQMAACISSAIARTRPTVETISRRI